MIYIKVFATAFIMLQVMFLYGLTETGFRPSIFDRIVLVLGFIAVFLAIWL